MFVQIKCCVTHFSDGTNKRRKNLHKHSAFSARRRRERETRSLATHLWKFLVPKPTGTWSQKSPGQTSTCNDVFDANASSSVRGKASLCSTSFTEAQNAKFLRWSPNGVQYVNLIDTPRPQLGQGQFQGAPSESAEPTRRQVRRPAHQYRGSFTAQNGFAKREKIRFAPERLPLNCRTHLQTAS